MASREKDFWQAREDWSRRKHLILDYYLTAAAAKLRQVSPDGRVIILDAFAGRGEYEDGAPGSPVLMGQLADRVHSWSNPVDLKVFNIEPDTESFQELERCTETWTARGVIQNLFGTFQQRLPVVLREARQSPVFAFLDPFRPKDLLFDDFGPLLTRSSITELCIVFHTSAVIRVLEAVRPGARTREQQKLGLQTPLNEIFGSSRWEELVSHASLEAEAVVGCFRDELRARGARGARGHTYVASHAIRAGYKVGLKYHILFFTRNAHGVRLMNDAVCKEAGDVYERTGRSAQMKMSLFPDERAPPVEMDQVERIRVLRDTLIAIARTGARRWRRSALILESLLRRWGEFTQREHLQALRELLTRSTGPRFQPLDGKPTQNGGWITNDQTTLVFVE